MAAARMPSPRTLGYTLLFAIAGAAFLAFPGDAVHAWGLNGFRSLAPGARALVLVAALGLGIAARALRSATAWAAIAIAGCCLVAFPLAESIHWLGTESIRSNAREAIPPPTSPTRCRDRRATASAIPCLPVPPRTHSLARSFPA